MVSLLICQIEKRLGSFHLSIDLRVDDHVTALFGPSGSGKSLTMQAIAGLMTPDSGEIQIGDRTVYHAEKRINLPPQERRVGYLFQNYALFPHMTVAANIAYGLHRLPRDEREQRVADAIAAVRLTGLERRRPAQLSGGQQQRVALARALVTRPDILLLDEPFAALDQSIRQELHGQLMELLRELPVPTLLVTHQLEEAYALSRTIAVYQAGRILQVGPRDQVYGKPYSMGVAAQVGFTNEIPGVVIETGNGSTRIRACGLDLLAPETPFRVGQSVICAIRPEHVMLVRKDMDRSGRSGTVIPGRILDELMYGGDLVLRFRPEPTGSGEPVPDLRVVIPSYVYERLGMATEKRWEVALHPAYLLVFAAPEPLHGNEGREEHEPGTFSAE